MNHFSFGTILNGKFLVWKYSRWPNFQRELRPSGRPQRKLRSYAAKSTRIEVVPTEKSARIEVVMPPKISESYSCGKILVGLVFNEDFSPARIKLLTAVFVELRSSSMCHWDVVVFSFQFWLNQFNSIQYLLRVPAEATTRPNGPPRQLPVIDLAVDLLWR